MIKDFATKGAGQTGFFFLCVEKYLILSRYIINCHYFNDRLINLNFILFYHMNPYFDNRKHSRMYREDPSSQLFLYLYLIRQNVVCAYR